MKFSDQNVYEMAAEHGGPGFWVKRTTWAATIAKVVWIGRMAGPAPYYGNPGVAIDVYNLDGTLREQGATMSAPGTYKTWRRIEPPDWA